MPSYCLSSLTLFKKNNPIPEPTENFGSLPDHVLNYLFDFSNTQDLIHLSSVNQRFYNITKTQLKMKLKLHTLNNLENVTKPIKNLSAAKNILKQIDHFTKSWLKNAPNIKAEQKIFAVILLNIFKIMVYLQKNFKYTHFERTKLKYTYTNIGSNFSIEHPSITDKDLKRVQMNFEAVKSNFDDCDKFLLSLVKDIKNIFSNSKWRFMNLFRNKEVEHIIDKLKNLFEAIVNLDPEEKKSNPNAMRR